MPALVDTSAFIAVLDGDDAQHRAGRAAWEALLDTGETLCTSNYIVVETCAVLQRHCGSAAVRVFLLELLPAVAVVWIDERMHHAGTAAFLAAARRKLSLVDCTSFELMRGRGVTRVFTFDRHFREQGFASIPAAKR
jgi:predicted nucleic acid-binding protein